jgi:hypothetical protein
MKALIIAVAAVGVLAAPYAGNAQSFDDPFNDYLQRSVTISMGAGNAKNANAAIHIINPWPRYVGNNRIHTTGRQGVNAVERMYRVPNRFEREGAEAGPALSVTTSSPGGESTTSLTAAPPTPVQPVTGGN